VSRRALLRDIAAGEIVRCSDVAVPGSAAVQGGDIGRRFAVPPAATAAQ
jgi:hypothetical protein